MDLIIYIRLKRIFILLSVGIMGNTAVYRRNTIESDSKTIAVLLLAAKSGQWEHVWQILDDPDKTRFFNVIPENRRWGILHQGVYWNKTNVIKKLLTYDACDTDTKAKICRSEFCMTTKMTALDIATSYNYEDMIAALSEHENNISMQDVPTLQPYESNNDSTGLELISLTLSAYKDTFHPEPIHPEKGIVTLLGHIYTQITKSKDRWKAVKEKVYDSVYVVCEYNAKVIQESKTQQEFFKNVINTYTVEDNFMYTYLNLAFRRQKSQNYRPTGHDLAMGPFAVIYQMLLLFWCELTRENGITYRRMMLSTEDVNQYRIGTRFVWQSIVSSSVSMSNAEPFPTCGTAGDLVVIFIIDNKVKSPWQPRNIENYSDCQEYERTYPAGAKFEVIGRTRKKEEIHVKLKLLA